MRPWSCLTRLVDEVQASELDLIVAGVLAGDRTWIGRAITLVESRKNSDSDQANSLLETLLPHSGSSFRVGITGAPGVGKSTFIDTLIGLVPPQSGEISVNSKEQNLSKKEWKNCIGYVPQNIYLVDDSIKNNIAFGVQDNDINLSKIKEIIKIVQLENLITELEKGYETFVGDKGIKLSGGQKQRIGIARALYNNPSILILDEATSSLDIFTEKEIMDFIFSLKGQITVLIVSHRLSTVEKCDYIYELENGVISYEGNAKNVIDKINKKYNS